jgi:WhiB family redox-sensing transcriptional regulator
MNLLNYFNMNKSGPESLPEIASMQHRSVDAGVLNIAGAALPQAELTNPYGDWRLSANCRGVDPNVFFPERGESTKEAKEICRACVARIACLEYAVVNCIAVGIWGGEPGSGRRSLRKQRLNLAD